MKIVVVIEDFQPSAGGNERSTEQIARRLIQRGHDLTVLANTGDGATDPLPGGRVVVADRLDTKYAMGLIGFRRWSEEQLRRRDFDVSLSMTTAIPATVIQPRGGTSRETLARNLALRRSKWRRLLKSLTVAVNAKKQALLLAERRTIRDPMVRKFVAISEYVVRQLTEYYAVPRERIELIPNAAEVNQLDPQDRQTLRKQIRAQLLLDEENVVFLFAAMNPVLKGLGQLLEAFSRLRKEQPASRLLVAGKLHGSSQRLSKRLGVGAAIRWVGPTQQMDELYVAADVTVLPSWYDPSSKVVLESLLHGTPAISTLYNGASQWIYCPSGKEQIPLPFDTTSSFGTPNGQCAGRVIDSPANVEGLAKAMADLCDDEERARCSRATEGIDRHIGMEKHVDRLERLLEDVAGQNESCNS